MNEAEFTQLLEIGMRRPLTADEQARLEALSAENPALKEVWHEEIELNHLIDGLPDAPLASNFTRQVLDAVARERQVRPKRSRFWQWLGWGHPVRQLAGACVLLLLGSVGYAQYQIAQRQKMALALSQVGPSLDVPSEAVALAPEEVWRDFDAINRLGKVQPKPDEELLSVLSEFAMK